MVPRDEVEAAGCAAWRARAALLLLVLALGLRVGHALSYRASPLYERPILDMLFHDQWAQELAAGNWLGQRAFFRAPLYPYQLGLIYRLAGHDYLAPRLVQAAQGTATCLLVYLLARRWFGPRAALLALGLQALYWPCIFFEGELLLETTAVMLDLLALLLVARALERGATGPWVLAGAALGLAAVARPTVLLFGAAVPFLAERRWRAALALALGAALPVAPVTLHNWAHSGDFVLVAWQGGVNFYIGNNPFADGHTPLIPGVRPGLEDSLEDACLVAEGEAGHPLGPAAISAYWYGRGLAFVRENPATALRLLALKTLLLVLPPELPDNLSLHFHRRYSAVLRLPLPGAPLVFPLGVAGVALALARGRGRALALPLAWLVLYGAGVAAFFVTARLRLPLTPVFVAFGASFAVEVLDGWREGGRRALARPLALFLVLAALLNYPWLGHEGYLVDLDSNSFCTVGNAWISLGRPDLAVLDWERALAANVARPDLLFERRTPSLHEALGLALLELGRPAEAMPHLREAVRLAPEASVRAAAVLSERRGSSP